VLVYAQLGGLAAIALIVAVRGTGPAGRASLLAIPAAISGTLGLFAYYRGMAVGAMSVVAPIAGVSAVVPVIVGIASGDRPSPGSSRDRVRARGVFLASREPGRAGARLAAGVGLALLAAIGFGGYFPPMHAAGKRTSGGRRSSSGSRRRVILAAVAVAPEARVAPRADCCRARADRLRRHVRQPPLRRRLDARPRQHHVGARVALPDRDRRARAASCCRSASRARRRRASRSRSPASR
jgi:hypothetical protein